MDRISQISGNLSGSFSLHSLAEGSEAISEVEEIHEIHSLKEKGDKAFASKNYQEALQCYNDALEIDENQKDALSSRAAVYIQINNFILAQQDAERLLALSPQNPQGHYLLGISLDNAGQYREALLSFLRALDLDGNTDHTSMLADNVAALSRHFCNIPDKLLENLPEMDAYKKLCEVGACLYQDRKYELCVKVLTAAQKLQTNQKGITMKIQLTLANAHSVLKHKDIAVSLYQECLTTAISAHDHQYQTKALVNIASLHLESNNTHQAVVYYEKLLNLQKELQGEDPSAPLPEYWSKDLECALRLNLSIAYKTIGAMEKAIIHAARYVDLIKDNEEKCHLEAQSHHNIGMLNEVLGKQMEAVEHYKKFLKMSKSKGDKKGMALAYGCLGSVYASLRNRQLAVTYHEQHITIAKKMGDPKLLAVAHEQMGDTLTKLEYYDDAIESFSEMFQACPRNDLRTQTTALCKIGLTYRHIERFQYSLYYYEQAKIIANDFDFTDLKIMCEFNQACILQHSTQVFEVDQARVYFEKLIPLFEAKIQQHYDEDTFCPTELHNKLDQCYDGIQMLLSRTGKKDDCLVYAESQRRKSAVQLMSTASGRHVSSSGTDTAIGIKYAWTVARMARAVSQNGSTILYFSVLEEMVLAWVLQPGLGIVRFHQNKVHEFETNVNDLIIEHTANLKKGIDHKDIAYKCENRALPLKGTALELIKKKNEMLTMDYEEEDEDDKSMTSESQKTSSSYFTSSHKPAERKLFDLLFVGIDDILSKLEPDSPLVIIPDKALLHCPFSVIQDWDGKLMSERFRLTIIPSLYLLEKVSQNELSQLKLKDDIDFARAQTRLGGLSALLGPADSLKTHRELQPISEQWDSVSIDTRKTSNPRLVKTGSLKRSEITKRPLLSRESTYMSQAAASTKSFGKKSSVSAVSNAVPPKVLQPIGAPASLDKMLHAQNLTTLTTKTSTNTDIVANSCGVTEFRQISNKDVCVVYGNPKLPENCMLHGLEWSPGEQLAQAQAECYRVADVLDVEAVVGEQAEKKSFLTDIQHATILHVATYGCVQEGCLVMAPNVDRDEKGPPNERSYMITAKEIAACHLVAKLVVISSGWSTYPRDSVQDHSLLSSAFIIAGAQCVLQLLWPVPSATLEKFYFHLYTSLLSGLHITQAVSKSMHELKQDNRYSDSACWSPFVLVGKDVEININQIRHAMLDQKLDNAEQQVAKETNINHLSPVIPNPSGLSRDDNLQKLQQCLARLLAQHLHQAQIIPHLLDLLDGSLKRLHVEDNIKRSSHLPVDIGHSEPAIQLLKLLGFHFQAMGAQLTEPYVVYPHWNVDDLLVPTFDALRAALDLSSNPMCVRALFELLPTSQEVISYLVDVLCITRHAPEIQLKVSDLTVKLLWNNPKVKATMESFGFHQIGPLLAFTNVPSNRKILTSCLQLLISVSIHKSPALIHKLDVTLLGGPSSPTKTSLASMEGLKLPSLTPLILPRNQLRMSTPWLSTVERPEEMNEKLKLARSKSEVGSEFQQHLIRAKTWHQQTLSAQADENFEKIGRPQTTPVKVKVKSGSSASCLRVPLYEQPELTIKETNQRRDYAHFLLNQRMDNVTVRHRDHIRKLYLPYVQN